MSPCLTRQDGSRVNEEPHLERCEACGPACDTYPCVNANPEGREKIEAALAAKE
jgi:hypothetical protein